MPTYLFLFVGYCINVAKFIEKERLIMIKKIFTTKNMAKMAGVINCLALLAVSQTSNAACSWIFGQPKQPDSAKKFRKF